jgi:hypothetical protein
LTQRPRRVFVCVPAKSLCGCFGAAHFRNGARF